MRMQLRMAIWPIELVHVNCFVAPVVWNKIDLCASEWALWMDALNVFSTFDTFFTCTAIVVVVAAAVIHRPVHYTIIDTLSSTPNLCPERHNILPLLSMRNKHKNAIGYYVHTNFIRTSVVFHTFMFSKQKNSLQPQIYWILACVLASIYKV